jgi:hypothetical protein
MEESGSGKHFEISSKGTEVVAAEKRSRTALDQGLAWVLQTVSIFRLDREVGK